MRSKKAIENYTQGGRKISEAYEPQGLFELLFAVMRVLLVAGKCSGNFSKLTHKISNCFSSSDVLFLGWFSLLLSLLINEHFPLQLSSGLLLFTHSTFA